MLTADGSDRILEERGYEHEDSGCYVFLRGSRPRPDALLCITEALYWVPPREEPMLEYHTAKMELELALREDRVHATGQDGTGQPIDIPAKSWLFAQISLTADGGHMAADGTGDQFGISRLRFPANELKALWADTSSEPGKLSAKSGYQRKRGRPAMPTETMTTMAATMLGIGFSRKQVLEVLRRTVALERDITKDRALRVARTILAKTSVGNS